jgi:hypothetical protein
MGIGMACSMHEMRNAYNFFVREPEKSGQRWKRVNIKMNFKEMTYKHVESGVVRDGKGARSRFL